ncbi:MAG: dethiobiotin synthase [Desulfobulbales bacterium]|nr:dethiobiotin synthase [Desulfobulbales bacterium]
MGPNHTLFITATDTGVGKTLISGLLLGFLRGKGIEAGYQKWVGTGAADNSADLDTCLDISGVETSPDPLDQQAPYRFNFPASPHLAAELEGVTIDLEKIIGAYRRMADRHEVLVVEGAGGLLVPLSRELLLADLLAQLELPTIIVSRSGLGTINHTLLTIEAMRARRIPIAGVICTDSKDEDEVIAGDNMKILAGMGRIEVFGRLPYCQNEQELKDAFLPIGKRIMAALPYPG